MTNERKIEEIIFLMSLPVSERQKWRVNDGCDEIGDDGPCRYRTISELCESWYPDLPDGYESDEVDEDDYTDENGDLRVDEYHQALLEQYQGEKADENWDLLVEADIWLNSCEKDLLLQALETVISRAKSGQTIVRDWLRQPIEK